MNFKLVFKLTGRALLLQAAAMVLSLAVCLIYGESPRPFLLSILITGVIGLVLSRLKSNSKFFPREGYFTVGLIWLLFSLFGSLPFWFCGQFPSFVDCLFESTSGFTTTGASVLTDIEALPYGILFWRAFSHWMGGMAILVLTMTMLPSLGVRSIFLLQAEGPGIAKSKLVPRVSDASKILYGIYITLTMVVFLSLLLAGMNVFDAITHAFSIAGTGGFSVKNLSIAAYASPAIEIICTVSMLLFSVNFTVFFMLLCGKWKRVVQNEELRFFLGVVIVSALFVTVLIRDCCSGIGQALRYAFFQVATVISSSGFSSTDYNLWPSAVQMLMILLMFIGACAGSTGGGIKCARVLVLIKSFRREIRQIIHPRSVNVVKLDGRVMEEQSLHTAHAFFAVYLCLLPLAAILIGLDGYSFTTTITAAISALSNVGPGFDMVGPMGNYSFFSPFSKIVLSLSMIIGRLEIFPILVLFSKNAWKRS